MRYEIGRELSRFKALAERLGGEPLAPGAYALRPKRIAMSLPAGKDLGLTLMGIVHGNEWAGLATLNNTLSLIEAGVVELKMPVAFVIGNPDAARENKRFLGKDLNRSFAAKPNGGNIPEEARARELGRILERTAYLVDFHQTSRSGDRPFFIFPYNRRSFLFARGIAPRKTIVTHWGRPFSAEGMCSDEFTNSHGGCGVSLELGQNGFDPYQIAVGVDCALWAIATTQRFLERGEALSAHGDPESEGELYTWAEIMDWPAEGSHVELVEGLTNFREIAAGERLGAVDGRPIVARVAGRMLFPKYLTREQQNALETRPTELCRLVRRISESDLPG